MIRKAKAKHINHVQLDWVYIANTQIRDLAAQLRQQRADAWAQMTIAETAKIVFYPNRKQNRKHWSILCAEHAFRVSLHRQAKKRYAKFCAQHESALLTPR